MKPQPKPLPVVFRLFGGEVVALFPSLAVGSTCGDCMSYAHIGQHGSADYGHVVSHSRSAKPTEYADLLTELGRRGYELAVYCREQPRMHEARMSQHAGFATYH